MGMIRMSPRAASHDWSDAASRTRPCKISAVASPGFSCFGKPSARDHADEGLAHHLLMTTEDSVRGMSTTRGGGQLHLLACEGLEGDLLHANSVPSPSDAGRPGVRVGKQCRTAPCSVHAVRPAASLAWRHDRWLPLARVQPVRRRHSAGPRRRRSTQPQASAELIAFVSDREGSDALFVMRSDGSGVRRLTGDLPAVSHPAWSADGQRIAFNAGSPTASDIYLINLDGSGLTKITNDAGANFYPTWSPDGSRLAFSSNRDGDWDIYVMNADGSRVRQLVDSPGLDDKPQWSPDGSRIGFATARSGSAQNCWRSTRRPVEEETLFPQPTSGLNPAWSWDGSQLAFNVVTSSGFDIEVMAPDGDDRRSVVASDASEERPRWSPDGRQLTYYSDAGGSWEVYTVLVETGAARSLTDGPGFDGQPAWQPSPR